MSRFKIYSSSAGSGKTYTLAKEYLKLALMDDPNTPGKFNPSYFRHILAVTFTNDAAHEMKQRILGYLSGFARMDELPEGERKKLLPLRNSVRDELNQTREIPLTDTDLTNRARSVFNRMLHRYSDFSVGTIDSFIQRVVTAFAEELDLPANFETSLEQEILLEAAVESLLARAGHEDFSDLTRLISDFAEEKVSDGGNFNRIRATLQSAGKMLLEEHQHENIERLCELTPDELNGLFQRLKIHNANLDRQMQTQAQRALDLIKENNLTGEHLASGSRGIYSFFSKWATEPNFEKITLSSTSAKTMETGKWTSGSAKGADKAAVESIQDQLHEWASFLHENHQLHQGRYLIYRELGKWLQQMALIGHLRDELKKLQQESGQIHLSNYGKAVRNVVLQEPMPFVYERIGERYHHILLDEFQDTSSTQWVNFLPLVSNSLGEGYFSLAVGDGKQAIYGWRGGELEQIVHLYNRNLAALLPAVNAPGYDTLVEHYFPLEDGIEPAALTTNFRSCEEIVQFNNDFFRVVLDRYQTQWPLLGPVYETYEQHLPDQSLNGGHVQIDFIERGGSALMLDALLERIREAERDGYEWRDMAVLCRRNRDGQAVADFLKKSGYVVVSTDSLLLRFSDSVQLVVALLRLLHEPDGSLPRYEVLVRFHQVILSASPNDAQMEVFRSVVSDPDADRIYQYLAQQGCNLDAFHLQQAGLYELTEKLIVSLRLFERTDETAYLFRLLDVVLDYTTRQSTHLSDFLRYWEEKEGKLSIQTPNGANAITVTSVHRSKGLEYPVVLVPFADWPTKAQWDSRLWADLERLDYEELTVGFDENEQPRRLTISPVFQVKALSNTPLKAQLERAQEKTFIENLNMLYVAVTRPTDRLYLLPRLGKNGSVEADTVAFLLKEYLEEIGHWNPEVFSYCLTCGREKQTKATEVIAPEVLEISRIISFDRTARMQLRRVSEHLFDLETAEKSREWGHKIKTILGRIKNHTQVSRAVDALVREGWLTPAESGPLRRDVDELLSKPQLKPLFEDGLRVELKREILLPNGDSIYPDRVVWLPDRIVVVDYKTGTPAENHIRKVRRCVNLYRQMGHQRVEGMLVYVDKFKIQEVGSGPVLVPD